MSKSATSSSGIPFSKRKSIKRKNAIAPQVGIGSLPREEGMAEKAR
jgi:hypothetical protein